MEDASGLFTIQTILTEQSLLFISQDEIAKVLKFGVPTSKIIYANPCKQNAFIRYAAKQDVQMMTFDNEAELYKVKAAFPNAR